jgi:FKBP-type peptidyl-prolyl cis-trans isomerase FklB
MKRILLPALSLALAISALCLFPVLFTQAQQPRPQQTPAGGNLVPLNQAPQATPGPAVPGLSTDKQKVSYVIGYSMGGHLHGSSITPDDVDFQVFVRGVNDALSSSKPALSKADITQVMTDFTNRLQERAKMVADKTKKEGENFLAANKTKEGVKTLPDGLQYKVLKSGNGPTPGPTDIVKAHYKGTLLDGTVFDSSYDHEGGQPEQFPVNRVIKGWTEALQLMKVGDKWELYVPSELAYGEAGYPPAIGPNQVLVFDVELLDVSKGSNNTPLNLNGLQQ